MNVLDFYRNEIAIDDFWRRRLGLTKEKRLNFRPLKYKRLNESSFLYWVFLFTWPFLLIGFSLFLFLRSLCRPVCSIDALSGKTVWLESSSKSVHIRGGLTLPGFYVVDLRSYDFYEFISRAAKVKIFLTSIWQIICLRGRVSTSDKIQFIDIYQLTCFAFFIGRLCEKAEGLHICNHYDRWAVACFESFVGGVTVWQHGTLNENLVLPVKLRNVSCIHALNDNEAKIWRGYLDASTVVIDVRKPYFKINSEIASCDLLVISHPAYMDDELKLMLSVLDESQLTSVSYKPHPLYEYSNILADLKNNAVRILCADEFPYAKLAITKGSTLGLEYESVGVEVWYWGGETCSELALRIREALNER